MRQRSTERAMLSADRTRIKNRIHSVLHQRLVEAPSGDLFCGRNFAWLKDLKLDPFGKDSLDRHIRQLERVEKEIEALNSQIAAHAYQHPRIKLLMTLPGVDFTVAETILAALGDLSRFPTPDKAASYLGLVPSTRQSGDRCYHGPITKQGVRHARWLLVQAAQHAGLHPGPLGAFFRRIAKKKNRNVWYLPPRNPVWCPRLHQGSAPLVRQPRSHVAPDPVQQQTVQRLRFHAVAFCPQRFAL
jgi:transposase